MSKSTVELVEENWAKIAAELDLDADEAPEWRSWDESYFESASTEWRVGTDDDFIRNASSDTAGRRHLPRHQRLALCRSTERASR